MILDDPISNGTMGSMWERMWCERCVHDHTAHIDEYDPDKTCTIHNAILLDDFPIVEITDENEGGGWDPALLKCERFCPCVECDS